MTVIAEATFVLTGALSGRTINLGSQPYPFVDGRLTIRAPVDELALHAQFLERNWQARPEGAGGIDGERDLQTDGGEKVPGGGEPDGGGPPSGDDPDEGKGSTLPPAGDGGTVSDGDGHTALLNERLLRAIQSLDPTDDSHWTKDGRPAVSAVEARYGAADVTRADIESAAPGFTRDKAAGKE